MKANENIISNLIGILFFKTSSWFGEPNMTESRLWAKGVKLSDELWWIVGGTTTLNVKLKSTEIFNVTSNQFTKYFDLPMGMVYHNIFNINDTHVALISPSETNNIYIFDR